MNTELKTQWYHSIITGYTVFVTEYDTALVHFRDQHNNHGRMPTNNFKLLFKAGMRDGDE